MGPDVHYGLLHGRLSSEEKAAALDAFSCGDTNVLIATTVVEVKPPLNTWPPSSWGASAIMLSWQHINTIVSSPGHRKLTCSRCSYTEPEVPCRHPRELLHLPGWANLL